jgi:hypothetical protein
VIIQRLLSVQKGNVGLVLMEDDIAAQLDV